MAASFRLELVTPEKLLFSQDVLFATVPGQDGMFGVLPGHAPFVSTVRPGIVQIGDEMDAQFFAVSGGYAEVLPSRVTVLVDEALESGQIREDEAQKLRDRSAEALHEMVAEDPEYVHVRNRVQFADTCLDLYQRVRKGRR
jgi:F-type H+-transporting ATPase subunit epsilon